MMDPHIDRIEDNLKKKIEVLESIYLSDKRIIEALSDKDAPELSVYDSYIDDQDQYMSSLDALDAEFDECFDYLNRHREIITACDQKTKSKINSLIRDADAKAVAVQDIEQRVKKLTDEYIEKKRGEISVTRKNARVIQNHYQARGFSFMENGSSFDTKIN